MWVIFRNQETSLLEQDIKIKWEIEINEEKASGHGLSLHKESVLRINMAGIANIP